MSEEQLKPATRLRVPDRSQLRMVVQCPDDLLPADHPARTVWAVVERLGAAGDLAAFAEPIKAREGVAGRDATDPRLLVALWLYAATEGVGSARELGRLCEPAGGGGRDAYRWLCGGVTVNHHTLSDFRVGSGDALDGLFTRVLAGLVDKGLLTVTRVSQDGTRVRACAGASSFRREGRLDELLAQADAHVSALRAMLDDPARSAGLSARKRAAAARAARERVERLGAAVAQMPELEAKQAALAAKAGKGRRGQEILEKEPRASTTDAEARVMKMPDGGFRPAYNVQLAVDTDSRAVVGVAVTNQGVDTGQAEPMRAQVEARTGSKVKEHLVDGGYLSLDDVERADAAGVALYVPPKPPRNRQERGSEYDPRPTDSRAVAAWRARMGSDEGKAVYKERASTSETVNADLKTHRGLGPLLPVRGIGKVTCVALWSALAYNLMHFAPALLA